MGGRGGKVFDELRGEAKCLDTLLSSEALRQAVSDAVRVQSGDGVLWRIPQRSFTDCAACASVSSGGCYKTAVRDTVLRCMGVLH